MVVVQSASQRPNKILVLVITLQKINYKKYTQASSPTAPSIASPPLQKKITQTYQPGSTLTLICAIGHTSTSKVKTKGR
jgi:hypothetical protein